MKLNLSTRLILVAYLILLAWWIIIHIQGTKSAPSNLWFAFVYGLVPLIGGISGLFLSGKWGGLKSSMGRAVLFLSAGLFTWGLGEMIWSYYILYLKVEVPYPSLADASFIISWPLWSVAVANLSKATGMKFSLKRTLGKILFFVIPVVVILGSYYLLYVVARQSTLDLTGGALKLFLDFAYPIWDVILLTLVLLIFGLSFGFLGGNFRLPIIIIVVGFVINYFADMGLSYQSTVGTYYNGNFADLLFATAVCLLTFGTNLLDPKLLDGKKVEDNSNA